MTNDQRAAHIRHWAVRVLNARKCESPARQSGNGTDCWNTLQQLEDNELQQFNALLTRLGVPNVFVTPKKPIG